MEQFYRLLALRDQDGAVNNFPSLDTLKINIKLVDWLSSPENKTRALEDGYIKEIRKASAEEIAEVKTFNKMITGEKKAFMKVYKETCLDFICAVKNIDSFPQDVAISEAEALFSELSKNIESLNAVEKDAVALFAISLKEKKALPVKKRLERTEYAPTDLGKKTFSKMLDPGENLRYLSPEVVKEKEAWIKSMANDSGDRRPIPSLIQSAESVIEEEEIVQTGQQMMKF